MIHFTILHWITLASFLVLFVFLCILAKKESNPKIFWSMIFASFLVVLMLSIFSIFLIDKYTKEAKLISVTHKRVLRNETINIYGKVKNVGNFKIGKCKIEIKIVSDALTGGNIEGSSVFKPTSGLVDFFKKADKNQKTASVRKVFIIAKDFKPNEIKNFSVSMRYPPHFRKPYMKFTISMDLNKKKFKR